MTERNDIYTPKPIVSTERHEVDIINPTPEMIDLADMAMALSREGRYTNLSTTPVTVLEHLHICDVLAEERGITDPAIRLLILLHDAHEAWLGDVCRPLKQHLNAASDGAMTAIETGMDWAIFRKFGLPNAYVRHDHPVRKELKVIDNLALAHEVHVAFPAVIARWGSLPEIDTLSTTHVSLRRLIRGEVYNPQQLIDIYMNRVTSLVATMKNPTPTSTPPTGVGAYVH